MLLVGVLLFALSGMVQPTSAGDKDGNDPPLKGPKVERRDMSKEKPLKNAKVKHVKGERIKDDKGEEHCAYSVHLVREPGEAPKAARQLAFDPDTCTWEVEFGELDEQEAQKLVNDEGERVPAVPTQSSSSLPHQAVDGIGTNAIGSSVGEFTAVTLDPVGIKTNEVRVGARWDYDSNQFKILGFSGWCTNWWLAATGWWRANSSCTQSSTWGNFTVVGNAHYQNRAFCNPQAITDAHYQGVSFRGHGNGRKEGWVNAFWDAGDCSWLLWQNTFLV